MHSLANPIHLAHTHRARNIVLQGVIKARYGPDAVNVGDEGGFAPNIRTADEGLDLLTEAIAQAGYTREVRLGLDAAATEFYDEASGAYDLNKKIPELAGKQLMSGEELIDYYAKLCETYPIVR